MKVLQRNSITIIITKTIGTHDIPLVHQLLSLMIILNGYFILRKNYLLVTYSLNLATGHFVDDAPLQIVIKISSQALGT